MKIISAKELKKLDGATIELEHISSTQLMDRAASAFFHWMMMENSGRFEHLAVLAGPGNNGGDGLVVTRLSAPYFRTISLYIINNSNNFSDDFNKQLQRLPETISVEYISKEEDIHKIKLDDALVIDAIFGYGLNRTASGFFARVIDHVNAAQKMVFSIDVPSGLFIDDITPSESIIRAEKTGTFELPKLSFFFIENYYFTGDWTVIPIGLSQRVLSNIESDFTVLERDMIKRIIKKRKPFHHKGSFGHSLIIAGSEGMGGAAVLATLASLKSGTGKTTAIVPDACTEIIQVSIPEAMIQKGHGRSVLIDLKTNLSVNGIGIGPGIGKNIKTSRALEDFLESSSDIPLVLDADALNIIAENNLIHKLPPNAIITPHPGEYSRMFGDHKNSFERIHSQINNSKKHNIYIVYKGAYTTITCPSGKVYFNHTGNPGMATAGSGDVLTGIITSLLAQKYTQLEACQLGVFIHGLAGDIAASSQGYIGLMARDIIEQLPAAFKEISNPN